MKEHLKKLQIKGFVVGTLVMGLLSLMVVAVATQTVTREITYGIRVMLHGEIVEFPEDSQPFVMAGRTFLPVGALADLLGLPVGFDPVENIAILGQDPRGYVSTSPDVSQTYLEVGDLYNFGGHVWRVLDIEGDRALLLSEYVIGRERQGNRWDLMGYPIDYPVFTWETSYIRYKLNEHFLTDTFTQGEQARIAQTQVINSNNPWFGTSGGNDTVDRIFLLSIDEVIRYFGDSSQLSNPNHPANENGDIYDQYNYRRAAITTAEGLHGWYGYESNIAHNWWLRSPSSHDRNYAGVNYDGSITLDGFWVGDAVWDGGSWSGHGIRPALWLYIN